MFKHIISYMRGARVFALAVLSVFLFCSYAYAQDVDASISVPYNFSFEEDETVELSKWVLNPGLGADTLSEKWIVGKAARSDGERSLYISNNGEDNQFGVGPLTQYAYRDILLPKGVYECSFDWCCVGAQGASLYAGIYDKETINSLTVGSSRAEIPSTVLTGCSLTNLYSASRWQHADFRVSSNGTRVLRMYFIWVNRNTETDLPMPIGACIDNIQITLANCKKPTNVQSQIIGDSMLVTWEGTSEQYAVEYRRHGRNKWNVTSGIYDEKHILEGLDEGSYDIRVCGICNNVDTSAYTYLNSVLVYYPDRHCIDYVHLENNPAIEVMYGTYTTPDQNEGIVDYGPDSKYSRHTINVNPDVYDPRTDNKLPTIAPNELASIRLGNWDVGSEAESMIFSYTVDESSAILLMHYAIVMEDPEHDTESQPRFRLEIIDAWGDLISPTCGDVDFIADMTRLDNGWHVTSRGVTWKEWTTIGLNLSDRMGETIRIRLTTYDCNWGGHYGYAYFSLDCVAARIVGTSCGDDAQMSIAAPDGFDYEWFDKYDNPVPAEKLSPDGQTLLVDATDTTTYRCHLTYLEEQSCGFDLYSSARPRFPIADFEWQYAPSNCQNRVKFTNKSHIMTKYNNVIEYHYDQPCDEYEWDFGNGQVGAERNPVVTFPQKGGTYNVTLYSSIAEGKCMDDTVITITLPEIGDKFLQVDSTICDGTYIVFGPQYLAAAGEYENTWKTATGCDSTVQMKLSVSPVTNEYVGDTTICAEVPLTMDGQTYKSHESGKFYRFYTNQYGCDSTLWMNVTVLDSILPIVTVREMSDAPNSGAIFIDGEGFDYYTVNGGEPQTSDSITGLNGGFFELEFFNDFGCSVVREAAVSVCMPGWVYQRWGDVLSLKNAEALDTDSATHVFTDFQWYKNNEAIPGANLSYLYVEEGLDPSASYHLEMTRVSNGEKVATCPFRPTAVEDQKVVYVYPSPVQVGGTLTVKVSEAASLTIVNMFGDIALTQALSEGTNSITMAVPAGIYVVQVQIGSETRVCRISVIE